MRAIRLSFVWAFILVVTCFAASSSAENLPTAEERSLINAEAATLAVSAERLGHLLFEKYDDKAPGDELSRKAEETALAAISDLCDASYRVLLIVPRNTGIPSNVLGLESPADLLAYVIGEAADADGVMIGRHYRVDLASDGKTARSISALSMDCLSASKQELGEAEYLNHGATHGPTEVHVLLSLLYSMKFRLRTAIGLWEIDRGSVDIVGYDPAYRPEKPVLKDCKLDDGSSFSTTESACRKAGGQVLN